MHLTRARSKASPGERSPAATSYYGSDTPFPGAAHQPVHQDGFPLFPELGVKLPMYAVALNVALVEVDDASGPLEFFPGDERPADDAEPHRFTGPAGTILLRDPRVWHRGSPNRGVTRRPMLALLYTRSWYRFGLDRPVIDRSVYDALPSPGRRLFRGADLVPRHAAAGDRNRF